jgi:hypothetical protein
MGPAHADAFVVTVAYPQASRLSSSRVLRIPLASLSGMMQILHQQGAAVLQVGSPIVEAAPSESREPAGSTEKAHQGKRSSAKKGKESR